MMKHLLFIALSDTTHNMSHTQHNITHEWHKIYPPINSRDISTNESHIGLL